MAKEDIVEDPLQSMLRPYQEFGSIFHSLSSHFGTSHVPWYNLDCTKPSSVDSDRYFNLESSLFSLNQSGYSNFNCLSISNIFSCFGWNSSSLPFLVLPFSMSFLASYSNPKNLNFSFSQYPSSLIHPDLSSFIVIPSISGKNIGSNDLSEYSIPSSAYIKSFTPSYSRFFFQSIKAIKDRIGEVLNPWGSPVLASVISVLKSLGSIIASYNFFSSIFPSTMFG